MFPIGDDKLHGARTPYMTWLFILFNVILFIYELTLSQVQLEQFITEYGVVPAQILRGENTGSLISSMFLHGGWLHIIGNMLFLWVFGDNIEAVKGHIGFVLFYIIGGLAASFAHIYSNPASEIPSIGASGAVSAMLGAYIVWFPTSRIKVLVPIIFFITVIHMNAFFFLFIWAAQQFFYGFASIGTATAQTAGIAWWAHIGGFVFGLIVAIIFKIFDPTLRGLRR